MPSSSSPPFARHPLPMVERAGRLSLVPLSGPEFMALVTQQARSSEGGAISSQYEQELARGDSHVGALALQACGSNVGAISYGLLELPRLPGKSSLRIDVVVTRRHCRHLGVGALLTAGALNRLVGEHGARLHHISVMAVHPAMVQVFTRLGFERAAPNLPLYSRVIAQGGTAEFQAETDRVINLRLRDLRSLCVKCRRSDSNQPWCLAER